MTYLKPVIILFFSSITLSLSGQNYFEGRIQYSHEVKASSRQVNLEGLKRALGKGSTLSFKDGNYRHDYIGGIVEFDIYNQSDNKIYIKKRETDTVYWYDGSKGGESIKGLKSSPSKEEILGRVCDKLEIQYADHNKVEYYNSESIRINPEWFSQLKRDQQYRVDAIQKSIFLRSEINYPAFSVITRATKVEYVPIEMEIFKIPGSAILKNKE